jgi:hypothetical protein
MTALSDPDEVVTGGEVSEFVPVKGSNVVNPAMTDVGGPLNAPNEWFFLYENPGPEPVTIAALAVSAKLVDVP